MESGDGLLLRVRPRGAGLRAEALRAVADVSSLFGNGRVDLTRRANLQIRGVRRETLEAAQDRLAEAGLLDPDEAVEAVRNIVLSPLAGLDRAARFDGPAVAAALEAGLAAEAACRALPPKFSFLVDEGGRLPLGDIAADIRIEAEGGHARLSLGGDGAGAVWLTAVPPAQAAEAALALARAFPALAGKAGVRTMRALVDALGPEAIARAAGLAPATLPLRTGPRAAPVRRSDLFGGQTGFFGVGAPFGSFEAETIGALARLSPRGVRLTPWRALLLPGLGAQNAATLGALGLVTEACDPRLSVAACPGHPACLSGEAATRPLARTLAQRLDLAGLDGIALHISGCAKGCARGEAAPFTLVGREGRFDLVLDGRARDPAVLSGLDAGQAERALAAALASGRALAS